VPGQHRIRSVRPFPRPLAGLLLVVALPLQGEAPEQQEGDSPPHAGSVLVDAASGTVTLTAVLQAEAFQRSTPPDARYHALVSRRGGAAGKALMVTDAGDAEVAAALRRLGAADGGGVPLRAWTLRGLPLLRAPAARVRGSRVEVYLTWEGADRAYRLEELLEDGGGRGVEIRFGGNEEHDEHWDSGCILCLYSCPGGVLSNALYSIRDHRRGVGDFAAGGGFPADGTPVTVTLQLVSG
jgi:hypothetical protein